MVISMCSVAGASLDLLALLPCAPSPVLGSGEWFGLGSNTRTGMSEHVGLAVKLSSTVMLKKAVELHMVMLVNSELTSA
eukprot:364639-Chlamydomonas_euryale.AAC.20